MLVYIISLLNQIFDLSYPITMNLVVVNVLFFIFTSNTVISASRRHFSHELCRMVPSLPGWLTSPRTLDDRDGRSSRRTTAFARRSLILKPRGGATESPISADPEGVTLQGTVPSAESLYLPGLLDTSIHRTNKVRIFLHLRFLRLDRWCAQFFSFH